MAITNLELIIGFLIVLFVVLLIIMYFVSQLNKKLQNQVQQLRRDNRELIKRLEIISKSKIVD